MQAWAALTLYLRHISQPIVPTTTQALRWWIRLKSSQAQFKATIHLARRLKEDSPLILLQVEIIIWRQICSNIIMVVVTLITTQQLHHLITNSASISNQSNSIATWAKIRPNFKWPHHPQHTVLNRNWISIQAVVAWQMHWLPIALRNLWTMLVEMRLSSFWKISIIKISSSSSISLCKTWDTRTRMATKSTSKVKSKSLWAWVCKRRHVLYSKKVVINRASKITICSRSRITLELKYQLKS